MKTAKLSTIIFSILILAILLFVAAGYFFTQNNLCLDKGGYSIYFEKSYFIQNQGIFQNKSLSISDIPENSLVAKYYDSSRCSDRGSFYVRAGNKLVKTSTENYLDFVKEYNLNCSSCLLIDTSSFGPYRGIYEFSSMKAVCSVNDNLYRTGNTSDCVNVIGP